MAKVTTMSLSKKTLERFKAAKAIEYGDLSDEVGHERFLNDMLDDVYDEGEDDDE